MIKSEIHNPQSEISRLTKEELIGFLENWENMSLLFDNREQALIHFPALMEIALEDNERVNWRASWAADKINDMMQGIAAEWIPKLTESLHWLDHNGKKRQYLKLISLYPVSDNNESFLFDYCLDKLTSDTEDISVRVYAMQILYNISEKETELKKELLQIIEQEMEYRSSPGILTRGKKLASLLRKEIHNKNRLHTD
jgi:hypothetical protein